ncbi:hypothetical protein HPP92_010690 [Vanilla planifolia]|uniref:Uncharacterized protein n=1 Tax=Vanilla planifolia TaxID=51239 RepID=A0A835R5P6_VANPL|nr:hypothetical protein HPP92_010690 [Vanilla planifolia]
MSIDANVVLTSFFRPNLQFSVKHSKTSCLSSYEKDFRELVNVYTSSQLASSKGGNKNIGNCSRHSDVSPDEHGTTESGKDCGDNCDCCTGLVGDGYGQTLEEHQLTVEYLEDELDAPCRADDFDVSCAEFLGPSMNMELGETKQLSETHEPLGGGPTIIYVPTRNETTKLAGYLCRSGVRAAAYHAKVLLFLIIKLCNILSSFISS